MNLRPEPNEFDHLRTAAVSAEQALLGACLMSAQSLSVASSLLTADHWQERLHADVWAAMVDLQADGRTANPVTLIAKLGNPEVVTGTTLSSYLARCAAETSCAPPYVLDYAKQVREHWAAREVASLSEEVRASCLTPGVDSRHLIGEALQRLDEIRASLDGKSAGGATAGHVTAQVIDRMDRLSEGEVLDNLMTTGLHDLDTKLGGGFKPSDLVIIAGRPGMGKTLLAVSLARQMATAGHAGVFYSLEMPAEQIGARFIADISFSGPDSATASQIFQAQLPPHRIEHVRRCEADMRSLPLLIDDSSSMTVGQVAARTRTARDRFARSGKKLEFVIIDYLKFLKASDRYRGQRVLEVGEITGGLKSLAKDLDVAVILLAQLNREVEKTADKRPDLSHLRDSGEIEQDADLVMLLYREAYYLASDPSINSDEAKWTKMQEVQNKLEIIIAKQRMGQTGSVNVFCHPGASAVRDLARTQ